MNKWNGIYITSPEFLDTVQQWLAEKGEIFVRIEYVAAAGSYDGELHTKFEQFAERMRQIRNHAYVVVFKEFDVRVRGIVDDAFIENAAQIAVENGEYWILVCRTEGVFEESCRPNTQEETLEDLEYYRGQLCAFGVCPPFWYYDKAVTIEALTNLGNM